MRSRSDIPPDLIRKAAAIDPALLRWLEAAYPTDEERERSRTRNRRQLVLPIAHREPR
jgi:hypothetical protein